MKDVNMQNRYVYMQDSNVYVQRNYVHMQKKLQSGKVMKKISKISNIANVRLPTCKMLLINVDMQLNFVDVQYCHVDMREKYLTCNLFMSASTYIC